MIAALTNHLWQSTLFVVVAAIVAFALRKNGADVRHRVWLIASLKFLVPFSLLMSLGGALPVLAPAPQTVASGASTPGDLSAAVDRFAQPFSDDVLFSNTPVTPASAGIAWLSTALVSVWACGFVAIAFVRWRGWQRIRTAIRRSTPVQLPGPVPVRSAPGLLEPGVVGIWRPVLLVPAGIEHQLTPRQLDAVLAHEMCHVERRDNLTSAIHMIVEAAFWFHPLVWLVGARLVEERERACDEYVLRVCGEPQTYAESILNVCKLYVESPIACVSGVGGSDLRKRVAAILVSRVGLQLSVARKVTLTIAAVLAIVLPLVAGILIAPLHLSASGQTASAFAPQQNGGASARFDVASVKLCGPDAPSAGRSAGAVSNSPGYLYLQCLTLRSLVGYAYQVDSLLNKPYGPGGVPTVPELVRGGPSWAYSDKFTVEAKADGFKDSETLTTRTGQWSLKDPAVAAMLRSLLEDRFQLKAHRATEQQPMYALSVAKSGLKIKPIASGDCWQFVPGQPAPPHDKNAPSCDSWGGDGWGHHQATGLAIGNETPHFGRSFVDELFFIMRRMVIDKTGLAGKYSFVLEFTPDDSTPGLSGFGGCGGNAECEARMAAMGISTARPTTFKSGDTIFKAVEKLGLILEPVKAPAEYIVIDRAERLRPDKPVDEAAPPARAQGAKR